LQATSTAMALPIFVPAAALGRPDAVAPNDCIQLGMIGSGERANQLAHVLLGLADAQIVATCDPSQSKRQALKTRAEQAYADRRKGGSFQGCADYNDFRDLLARSDIDAVFITSPENWHALQAIAAAKAKKDVYVEKAMTRTIAEGQALVQAVRENQVVLQVGQQQRNDPIFRLAVDLVHQGELGELHTIKVGVPGNRTGPLVNPQPVPEGLDYDLWLGPAPVKPYQPERLVNMVWMSTYDYVIGYQAGWGCHHVDIALWGHRQREAAPVEVASRGVFPTEGICDCPLTWHSEFTFADGVKLIFTSEDQQQNGIRFEGSKARIHVNRARIDAGPDAFKPILESRLPAAYRPGHRDATPIHLRNFLDCVRSRQDPEVTVETGHHTNTICCLSDIATRLGRKLRWDPAKEQFLDDDEASKMLAREMRSPWHL
jgi:predicted dehydrogenase